MTGHPAAEQPTRDHTGRAARMPNGAGLRCHAGSATVRPASPAAREQRVSVATRMRAPCQQGALRRVRCETWPNAASAGTDVNGARVEVVT